MVNHTETSPPIHAFDLEPIVADAFELTEQCVAIALAICESKNQRQRDTLNWVLIDRLSYLHQTLSRGAEDSLNDAG